MKKTIAWIAIFAALLGLTACGSAGEAHTYTGTMTELVDSFYDDLFYHGYDCICK